MVTLEFSHTNHMKATKNLTLYKEMITVKKLKKETDI